MKRFLVWAAWKTPPVRWIFERQLGILDQTDPDALDPKLVGRFFLIGERVGRTICEMAVHDGAFGRNEDGTYFVKKSTGA